MSISMSLYALSFYVFHCLALILDFSNTTDTNGVRKCTRFQLFFAPYRSPTNGDEILPPSREFTCENVDGFVAPGKDKALRKRSFSITGLGMPPVSFRCAALGPSAMSQFAAPHDSTVTTETTIHSTPKT
jgi:hypothetical protein